MLKAVFIDIDPNRANNKEDNVRRRMTLFSTVSQGMKERPKKIDDDDDLPSPVLM
jgi:hypothetical protein